MRKWFAFVAIVATATGAALEWWRRHPRTGAATMNRLINPRLVAEGVPEASRGEIGLLEHVGRKSGIVRVTPVHPVPTEDGFRIIVPLGMQSQWARNVLAAGHCRLQVGAMVYELDEPRLVDPGDVEAMPPVAVELQRWLGFRYLQLHRFAEAPGALEVVAEAPARTEWEVEPAEPVPAG